MLDSHVARTPVTRLARYSVVVAGLALTASVASLAAQSPFATFAGTVHDQLGGTIPNIGITVTHAASGAKHEVRTNERGAFELLGLVPGNYSLVAGGIGFQNIEDTLQLAGGQTLRREMTLQVGTLQETIRIVDGPAGDTASRRAGTAAGSTSAPACTAEPNSGRIMPPKKVADMRPRYPASLQGSGVGGRVVLQALIGTDGNVREVRTVTATNPEFADAAQEAVRQWRFTQTLLNCVPIEVEMTVTAAFEANGTAQLQFDGRLAAPPPPPAGR